MQDPELLPCSGANRIVILIAEDELLMQCVTRRIFEKEGYVVLTASDGEEALRVSRNFPGIIHALLTDIRMPNLNGMQLREQIQVERPGIKVLLMSAHVFEPVTIPFLRKPFTPAVLRERMRELLAPAAP